MKRLLLILILTFSFQSIIKADDISDFMIEGISLGDSALDFFSEERLLERKKVGFIYPKEDFYSATIYRDPKFKLYNNIQLHIKKNDNNYIIHSIGGQIEFPNDINSCYEELENIISQFKNDFTYTDFYDSGVVSHADKVSGTVRSVYITLKKKDEIVIECYDYNKKTQEKMGHIDKLNLALDSSEFSQWLNNVYE
jgi:hypothetical protein